MLNKQKKQLLGKNAEKTLYQTFNQDLIEKVTTDKDSIHLYFSPDIMELMMILTGKYKISMRYDELSDFIELLLIAKETILSQYLTRGIMEGEKS